MEISIGKGIGNFVFGLSKNEIKLLLGQPDKEYSDDYEDIFFLYNNIKTSFKFEKENNYKLGWLETSNIETKLLGLNPWLHEKEELVNILSGLLSEKPEIEDYRSFESVTFNNSWLELQFEYNQLKHLNIGVLFDDKDNTIWPSA